MLKPPLLKQMEFGARKEAKGDKMTSKTPGMFPTF
jgi:hypothetical protein